MLILLAFALLGGLLTILSPCIWPLLPIVLSSTTSAGKYKPQGIALGVTLSFSTLLLLLSSFIDWAAWSDEALRYAAFGIIFFLGITLTIPKLTIWFEGIMSRLNSRFNQKLFTKSSPEKNSGFGSGFITGLTLGIIWTPCNGPILATVAALSASQSLSVEAVFVAIVYGIGVSVPLFFLAWGGQALFTKSRWLNKYLSTIQRVFGVIMIATAIAILLEWDKELQTWLLDTFPQYAEFLFDLEGSEVIEEELDDLRN